MTETRIIPGDTRIETIKVNWTGYARNRISEYNSGYTEDGLYDGTISPTRFLAATGRQKTNVVIESVEEADAVYHELTSYDSDQRVWMNGSMDRSIERVQRLIREAMEAQGYEIDWRQTKFGSVFEGFQPIEDDE